MKVDKLKGRFKSISNVDRARGGRAAVSSTLYLASVVVLALLAASGFVLYFATGGNTSIQTVTSVSKFATTVTTTVLSVITTRPTGGALSFNGTLVIIPNGIATNQSLDFTPSTVRVVVGVNNTITWLNQDTKSQHTVVSQSVPGGAQSFSAVIGSGQTFNTTLSIPGTYRYYCMWHPGWMKATIIVLSK